MLERLERKHGGTIAAVLAHAEACRARRAELAGAEVAIEARDGAAGGGAARSSRRAARRCTRRAPRRRRSWRPPCAGAWTSWR